jgi:hypothetical protein
MRIIIDYFFSLGIIISGIVAFLKMINFLFKPKIFKHTRFNFISAPPSERQLFVYNLILLLVAIEAFHFFWFER